MPAAQLDVDEVHADEPATAVVPVAQAVHDDVGVVEKVFSGHFVHTFAESAEYVPASQGTQDVSER